MRMKRKLSIVFALMLALTLSSRLEAQTFGAPNEMKGKFVVGGNFNLGIAGNCFYAGLAPQAGYRLTRSLEIGARVGYDLKYYWDPYGNYYYHYFAGAVYASYEIYSGIFVQVEDEEIGSLFSGTDVNGLKFNWTNSVFVGGGYRQYYDATGFAFFSLMYNLSWDPTSVNYTPYGNPFVIRVGICKGL